jgi:hypothetical protein
VHASDEFFAYAVVPDVTRVVAGYEEAIQYAEGDGVGASGQPIAGEGQGFQSSRLLLSPKSLLRIAKGDKIRRIMAVFL